MFETIILPRVPCGRFHRSARKFTSALSPIPAIIAAALPLRAQWADGSAEVARGEYRLARWPVVLPSARQGPLKDL